jgi:hypothetical protein
MKSVVGSLIDGDISREVAAHVSSEDFAQWWVDDVIYVRPCHTAKGNRYAVYAADGTFVDLFDSLGEIIITAHAQAMALATVH